jgi:imidazolonepropionase-like amidohydrolase
MRTAEDSSILTWVFAATALVFVTIATLQVFLSCEKGPTATEPGIVFALTNGTLIDGTGRAPIPNATIVIRAGLIESVGPEASTAVPEGAEVIDVGGATILPGFINAHVHSGFNEDNLKAWASDGVTMVRDLAGPTLFDWRDEKSRDPECARLVAAGPMVSVPNGYPLVPWGSPHMLPVTSAEDARSKVTQLLEAGADIIKLAMETGEEFQRTIPCLAPEEAQAVVNTAHDHGTIASAHVLVASDLARAVEAGVDDIAHMVVDSLPDSIVDVMVAEDMLWIPTLELWHHVGYGRRESAILHLRKFVLAGGQVALGTDYDGYGATFQMGMPINEMEWMLEAGMSPMQIIVAGTRNAARACNRLTDLGTLEAGKTADIIVVDGNPLDDIRNLSNVRLVVRGGGVIRRTGL